MCVLYIVVYSAIPPEKLDRKHYVAVFSVDDGGYIEKSGSQKCSSVFRFVVLWEVRRLVQRNSLEDQHHDGGGQRESSFAL